MHAKWGTKHYMDTEDYSVSTIWRENEEIARWTREDKCHKLRNEHWEMLELNKYKLAEKEGGCNESLEAKPGYLTVAEVLVFCDHPALRLLSQAPSD